MPPKAKFTRDEILEMAFQIAKEEGIDAVTARELGSRLGSSARPIFTVFENMDEVKELVILKSKELYGQYVEEGLKNQLAFRGVGMAYLRFAMEQPKLFWLLFMHRPAYGNLPLTQRADHAASRGEEPSLTRLKTIQEHKNVSVILPMIDDNYDKILQSVQAPYGLKREEAEKIYQHLWTYTHGIAAMMVTGLCSYSTEQLEERLTEVFQGLMMFVKSGNKSERIC